MSIYNIMAFNAATDKIKQNVQDSQNIEQKKVQTQTAQQELDLNKQLNQAKIKQARNEGMMSDYIGDALEKHLNEQHKAKADQLDAVSGLQDIAQHKAQTEALQAKQVATHLHDNDPDVQAHVNTLMGIMAANGKAGTPNMGQAQTPDMGQAQSPQMSMADGSNQGAQPLPSIPGIKPIQPQVAPAQPAQEVPAPVAQPQAQAPVQTPEQGQQQGIDLSPIEQTFGMPKGSMWLNPATMKPEVNPIWKAKIEKQQAAQAAYDVNQPFREVQRQDKLEQRATQLITKAVQNRSGGVGLQDNKVNAAIHARELINQAYNPETGEYDVTQVPYGELAESLGSLLSGGTGSSEGRVNALKQRTAQGDFNAALSYMSGKPSNATSQDALKQLVHMIDRQGEVSEKLRDTYVEQLKKLPVFNELDADRAQALLDTNIGNSFKEHLKNAPDKQIKSDVQKSNIPEGRVEVVSPDGKVGHIPAEQLQEAIKAGYKQRS